MGAGELVTAGNKTGYSGDSVTARLLPVGIDCVLECPLRQYFACLVGRKPHRLRDVDEHFQIANVAAIHEIRPVKRIVNCFETRPRIRPFREFLGQAAVVGMSAAIVRQDFGVHQTLHARMHGFKIHSSSREQILQRAAFSRCVGVKREVHPLHVDIEIPLQPFNTPGTDIAPGSDEVGEYFEFDGFRLHLPFGK